MLVWTVPAARCINGHEEEQNKLSCDGGQVPQHYAQARCARREAAARLNARPPHSACSCLRRCALC